MGLFTEIQGALEKRLSTMTDLPDVAWANTAYTPAVGTMYLRPTNLPVTPVGIGIHDSDAFLRAGFFQVDVFAPKNVGPGSATVQADAISAHFPVGLELFTTTGGYKIRIKSVAVESSNSEGTHYAVPVLISYIAITS